MKALVCGLAALIVAGFAAYWNGSWLRGHYHWAAHVQGHVLTEENERLLKAGASFRECIATEESYSKYCPEMIVVPAGKFTMGSPATEKDRYSSEDPQHEVTIPRPFAVSKFEVTFDQWDACNQYGGCVRIERLFEGARQPAINMDWDEAQQYVKWLSGLTGQQYRLLTEAEWEYAARAGSTTPYSFEGDESVLGEYAWYRKNSGDQAHPVGEKKPNAFGLYDVHGNVWEWVEDCYHGDYNGHPTDGSAWMTGDCGAHVSRGGSWGNIPRDLRSATRSRIAVVTRINFLGIRVGRTLLATDTATEIPLEE